VQARASFSNNKDLQMPRDLPKAFVGQTVNASGTRVATVKAAGTNKLDLTNPEAFNGMTVRHGNAQLPVATAIAMGLVAFQGGTLVELNGPGAAANPG
jgi:hypothetical protein